MTGGRGRGGRGGDSLRDMGVGSVQPVGDAMIHIFRLGRWIEILHGAEIFGGDRLEGRRPEGGLEEKRATIQHIFFCFSIEKLSEGHSKEGRATNYKSHCFY